MMIILLGITVPRGLGGEAEAAALEEVECPEVTMAEILYRSFD